jgi:hypothetical protein
MPHYILESETAVPSTEQVSPAADANNDQEEKKPAWESAMVRQIWDEGPSEPASDNNLVPAWTDNHDMHPDRARFLQEEQWQTVTHHSMPSAPSAPSSVRSKESHSRASPISRQATALKDPQDTLELNTIVFATMSVPKTSHIVMGFKNGDKIRVLKYVSGVMYQGLNLQSGLTGQFNKHMVEEGGREYLHTKVQQPPIGHPSAYHPLDNIEAVSAAEWNGDYKVTNSNQAASDAPSSRLPPRLDDGLSRSGSGPSSSIESINTPENDTVTLTRADLDRMLDKKAKFFLKPWIINTDNGRLANLWMLEVMLLSLQV